MRSEGIEPGVALVVHAVVAAAPGGELPLAAWEAGAEPARRAAATLGLTAAERYALLLAEPTMSAETMRYKECGGVLLAVQNADTPSDQEWNTFIEYCQGFPDCNKTLVYTLGGGPNAKQRKELNDRYVSKHKARGRYTVAVMSDSPGIRFVVSALNLFNQDAASFAYNNGAGMPAALKHLGITDGATAGRITLEVRRMLLDLKK